MSSVQVKPKVNLIEDIESNVKLAKMEKTKFYGDNNLASGRRYRALLSVIAKQCKEARQDVQDENRRRGNLAFTENE